MLQNQSALAFELPEPHAYHDIARTGFFAVLVQQQGGRKVQRCYKLQAMPGVLDSLDPACDSWISQGEFFKPNRRVVNLLAMPLAFVDLDTYKVPGVSRMTVDGQVALLLETCDNDLIPPPSIVVGSGRGLQVKWLFEKPIPQAALPRWQALQNELCARLTPLGADKFARDASRVLRVVDTMNSKSKTLVRVAHQTTIATMGGVKLDSGLVVYGFDELADTVLPHTRAELQALQQQREDEQAKREVAQRARDAVRRQLQVVGRSPSNNARSSNLRPFLPSQLAWDRLRDIRKLAELRGWTQGAPAGERDLPLFLCACFLAQAVVVPRFKDEIMELAREIAPTWTADQVKSCIHSVSARAEAAARGETVEFRGEAVDPRYRYKNATLIELLSISPSEEREMTAIISESEAQRRHARREQARRRAAGGVSREEYLRRHELKRQAALRMHAAGESWKKIAEEVGYANAEAARRSVR